MPESKMTPADWVKDHRDIFVFLFGLAIWCIGLAVVNEATVDPEDFKKNLLWYTGGTSIMGFIGFCIWAYD